MSAINNTGRKAPCQELNQICKNEKSTQETEKSRVSNYLYASFETLCEIDGNLRKPKGVRGLAASHRHKDKPRVTLSAQPHREIAPPWYTTDSLTGVTKCHKASDKQIETCGAT